MRSKLFRAVVGVGLSLGGAGAGCAGRSSSDDEGSAGDPNGTGGTAGAGGGAGAGTAAIPSDAGMDAPVDAFCDTAWPTTKANPAPPPSCDEQAECAGVDIPGHGFLRCRPKLGEHQCDYLLVTSECEEGAWQCPVDAMLDTECRCIGMAPAGMICTETGFVFADAGTGGGG